MRTLQVTQKIDENHAQLETLQELWEQVKKVHSTVNTTVSAVYIWCT